MNPKILLAFLGGAALAGGLALVIANRSHSAGAGTETAAVVSPAASEVERPIATDSSKESAVRPAGEGFRRSKAMPKAAPVVAANGRGNSSSSSANDNASGANGGKGNATTASAEPPRMIFPNPNDGPTAASVPPPAREETPKGQVFRPDPVQKPVRREPETVRIPAGTTISVRLSQTLNTDRVTSGESFSATLDSPLVINDIVLAEKGARVNGKIVESDKAGRVKGVAKLAIELTQIQLSDGQRLQLQTDPYVREGEHSNKTDAAKVGAGAALGAIIGAVAGGGKGAAIGAGAGGAAGTGVVLATRGKAAQIDVETRIPFRLRADHTVTEKIN